ncbi:hypothetical protein CQA37_05990 [Helicobacter sp. MIT 99-10781]|uniref:hypothetical protein n=1 Tax=Helicobacter sp. MIT 99-10781 TaxID=1332285 RepID=UPI000E20A21A|nr:hypothetical protein [Helicobacter sp. MIT 99-10781]RDU54163.1 hypothetical protein CQA37_05990 [Helicobacter sp. MIT 99-10781]
MKDSIWIWFFIFCAPILFLIGDMGDVIVCAIIGISFTVAYLIIKRTKELTNTEQNTVSDIKALKCGEIRTIREKLQKVHSDLNPVAKVFVTIVQILIGIMAGAAAIYFIFVTASIVRAKYFSEYRILYNIIPNKMVFYCNGEVIYETAIKDDKGNSINFRESPKDNGVTLTTFKLLKNEDGTIKYEEGEKFVCEFKKKRK